MEFCLTQCALIQGLLDRWGSPRSFAEHQAFN
jgi:hypothetical protein